VTKTSIARNVFFILLGLTVLILKRHYSGPFAETVYSYGGNVSVSFAVYFMIRISSFRRRFGALLSAGIALLAVELFEATNGFGVMTNVYDRFDFVANVAGVALALAIDTGASRIDAWRLNRHERADSETRDWTAA
jgi:hypothetical protein